jgi:predicted small lipoprotein YifL
MSRSLKLTAILVFATFALAACGKRGALEPPVTADQGETPQTKPAEKPHKDFVLDGLLR